jgi:hypothetical protein
MIGKLILGIALLIGYVWYKRWADWSLLPRLKFRPNLATLIEGIILVLLVLFIFFGLPGTLFKSAHH